MVAVLHSFEFTKKYFDRVIGIREGAVYFDISTNVYENLREKKKSDKYEYILPNIMYGKTFFTEKFGLGAFVSNT